MKSFSLVPVGLLATGIICSPSVMANNDLHEVLVSAALVPIPQEQSATAYTVINLQQLENRAPLLLSEVLRDVPGIAVSRNGVLGSSTQIRVRGAEANHLLVLIDGVEANDPGQGDELNWGTISASDIERVEIIRGPQSALHGSDAMAGVVNIITRKASKPFSAGVFSEAGSFNTYQSGFNLGSKGESYSVQLGASHLESEGDNISRQGSEEDGYRNTSVNLNSNLDLTEQLSLGLVARQSEGRNHFDEPDFFTDGLPADANSYSDFRSRTGRIHLNYDSLDGHWRHQLAYAYSNNRNDNTSFGFDNGNNATTKKQYQYLSSLNWDNRNQLISLLLEREEEDFRQRGMAFVSFGELYDPNQNRERDTDSVAVEYRGTFFDRLTFAASARHDDNSEFDSSDTYRLETAYRISDATRLRAAWGTAVKNPTFSERFGFFTNFIGNPDLKPEESKSWEIGLDQTLLDGKVQLGITAFKTELQDEIDGFVLDPITFGFTSDNKDGESHRQGVELEVQASLSDAISLAGSYTYTDAVEEDSFSGREIDEIRRPRHLGSLTLAWQALEKLQLNINAQYNGKQDDTWFPPFPPYELPVELDDYTLVNINATYAATDALDFYVRLENVLDEDYEEVFGFQTLGFGAYAGFRYNFAQ